MAKINCWEFKKCGREPNGEKIEELGICPVSIETKTDSFHEGKNGGRVCWVIAGTFCGGNVQGTFASKLDNCIDCEFYKLVYDEEGSQFMKFMQSDDEPIKKEIIKNFINRD